MVHFCRLKNLILSSKAKYGAVQRCWFLGSLQLEVECNKVIYNPRFQPNSLLHQSKTQDAKKPKRIFCTLVLWWEQTSSSCREKARILAVDCRTGNVPYSEVLPMDPYLQPSAASSLLLRECTGHFSVLHYWCVRKCFAQENEIYSCWTVSEGGWWTFGMHVSRYCFIYKQILKWKQLFHH